jgi:hypothetical protein
MCGILSRRCMDPGCESALLNDCTDLETDRLVFSIRFPLYPIGMDTYRFEYAVFLLNKDIETVCATVDESSAQKTDDLLPKLMAEQGLRAIDLRHTLPNLKNLILTLTHNTESTPYVLACLPLILCTKIIPASIIRIAPAPLATPTEDTAPTPRAVSPVPADALPAPVPTRSTFLSPFAAMLRSKYTGTSSRPKVVVEIAEPADDPDGLTPTSGDSVLTPRPNESQPDSSNAGANSSASEVEGHNDELKTVPPPPSNGVEKLGDKLTVETPPSSPFPHVVN